MSTARVTLADESGVAMIVAMIGMLIISLLTAATVTLAINTNSQSRHGTAQKQAAEAAEAGLQVALYRYNELAPSGANCVGDGVSAPSANGTCKSSAVTLGNGSSYQYYTTPVLTSSASCVGSNVMNSAGVSNICITSVGTSQGVSVRTEIRAATYQGASLFPYAGITAPGGISEVNGTYSINASEATNGKIYATSDTINQEPAYHLYLGPSASYSPTTNGTFAVPGITSLSSNIVLPPVNPGTSATTNVNNACTSSLTGSGCGISTQDDSNPYYQPDVYNPATRSLTTSGSAVLTLTGGVYNFCSFTSAGGLTVNVATGAKVAIYIDSPGADGCPLTATGLNLGSGTTTFNNPNTLANGAPDPTALQLYVVSQPVLNFSASYTFNGTLYAPISTVNLYNGSIVFNGALAANQVTMNNGLSFNWESQAGTLQASTQGLYYRTAWGQCTAAPSQSTPTTGCS